jgi:hypothetical protein
MKAVLLFICSFVMLRTWQMKLSLDHFNGPDLIMIENMYYIRWYCFMLSCAAALNVLMNRFFNRKALFDLVKKTPSKSFWKLLVQFMISVYNKLL